MLESLYSEALKKKKSISKKIEKYEKHDLNVSNYWNEGKIAKSNENLTIAAGDGSKHEKKFLTFYFYAISAESLIYNKSLPNTEESLKSNKPLPNTEESLNYNKSLSKIESSDINIMPHSKFASDRIRNYMGLFEIKNALKTIKTYDIDYYLYDGSILGDLIRPFPLKKDIPQNIKYEILDLAEDHLIKDINNIKNIEVEIASVKIANNILNKKFDEFREYNPVIFLEYIEKLLTLSNLLKYNKKIIAISKTSTATDYFKNEKTYIPDIAIFDKYSQNPGFSNPLPKPVFGEMEKLKREFPIEDGFFKSLKFTIFYLRLEKNKNILKIELPYKANKNDIKNIIRVINKDIVEGYPYLLKKAHNDVVIKKRDIEQLSKIIGFYEKSGREML